MLKLQNFLKHRYLDNINPDEVQWVEGLFNNRLRNVLREFNFFRDYGKNGVSRLILESTDSKNYNIFLLYFFALTGFKFLVEIPIIKSPLFIIAGE